MNLFFLGSLPHQDILQAVGFVQEHGSHLPFLPQLPELNSMEDGVAQVLRGIEKGKWDEQSSSALPLFAQRFKDEPRIKIQVTGPLTVSRATSQDYNVFWPHWFKFTQKLFSQLDQFGLTQQLWLQIDEPFWNAQVPFPPEYVGLLCSLRGMRRGTRVGIHSCARERPALEFGLLTSVNFLSLNFTEQPISAQELELFRKVWRTHPLELILGALGEDFQIKEDKISPLLHGGSLDNLWVSSPCGLSEFSVESLPGHFAQSSQ